MNKFIVVADGETLSLGDKTLTFILTPWVHWPETMSTYLAGVPFTIGASAAVCALVGAVLYYGKSRGGTYGRQLFMVPAVIKGIP